MTERNAFADILLSSLALERTVLFDHDSTLFDFLSGDRRRFCTVCSDASEERMRQPSDAIAVYPLLSHVFHVSPWQRDQGISSSNPPRLPISHQKQEVVFIHAGHDHRVHLTVMPASFNRDIACAV